MVISQEGFTKLEDEKAWQKSSNAERAACDVASFGIQAAQALLVDQYFLNPRGGESQGNPPIFARAWS